MIIDFLKVSAIGVSSAVVGTIATGVQLDEKTTVPIGVVVTLITAIGGAAWWVSAKFASFEAKFASFEKDIQEIKGAISGVDNQSKEQQNEKIHHHRHQRG